MRAIGFLSRLALLALLAAFPCQAATVAEPLDAEREAFFDGLMGQMLDTQNVAGALVTVVEDGRVVVDKGYGYTDLDRGVRADGVTSQFRIASVSKLFAFTAVMQLVEEGRLDLDADVNRYLDFRIPNTYAQPITLRHLITHTAGFEDRMLGLAAYPGQVRPDRTLGETMADSLPARVRPPGVQVAYSNYGAALAGYIVERVSGLSYADYVERRIFRPLGMRSTHFQQPGPDAMPPGFSRSYRYLNGGLSPRRVEYIYAAPAGGAASTGADMARFMLAHLNDGTLDGARILRPETARLMRTRTISNAPGAEGMAYGFYETEIEGRRLVGHGGKIAGFTSLLMLSPETQTGVFVVMNTQGRMMTVEQTVRAYFKRFHPGPPTPPSPTQVATADLAEYAGAYQPNIVNVTGVEHAPTLLAAARLRPHPDGGLVLTLGPEEIRWAPEAKDTFRRIQGGERGDRLVFLRDAQGRISGFVQGDRAYMAFRRLEVTETPQFAGAMGLLALAGALAAIGLAARTLWRRRDAPGMLLAARALGLASAVLLLASAATLVAGVAALGELPLAPPPALQVGATLAGLALAASLASAVLALGVARRGGVRLAGVLTLVSLMAMSPAYWLMHEARLFL